MYTTPFEDFRPKATTIVPEQVGAVFHSGGINNTSNLKKQTMRDRHGPPLKAYILRKTKWFEEQFRTIDWPAHKKALQGKTTSQLVSLVKLIHHWRSTLQRMHLIAQKKCQSAMCNICKCAIETQNHIYHCTHPASRTVQI